jgi:hypothetical protein
VNEITYLHENKQALTIEIDNMTQESKSYDEMTRRLTLETDARQIEIKEIAAKITD